MTSPMTRSRSGSMDSNPPALSLSLSKEERKAAKKAAKKAAEEATTTENGSLNGNGVHKIKKEKKIDNDDNDMIVEKKEKKEKKDKKDKKDKIKEENDMDTEVNVSKEEKKSKKKRSRSEDDDNNEENNNGGNGIIEKKKPRTEGLKFSPTETKEESDNDEEKGDSNPLISSFDVSQSNIKRLAEKGIKTLFPIQAQTYPLIFDGKDVMGRARTGTGKTLAFALPICERLQRSESSSKPAHGRAPRVIVLTPTRELAKQVSETFQLVGEKLTVTTVYGGSPYEQQESALRRGVDVVVGTCGRIKDLLEKGTLKLHNIQHIVMDEADEMLDMGFAEDVELILKTVPRGEDKKVQTLLFSATVPHWVEGVAKKYLRSDRTYIDLVGDNAARTNADITHYAIACHWTERNNVLNEVITVYGGGKKVRTIVFCETKKDANEICLSSSISSECQVMHGDISQQQRETTLKSFKENKFSILVCTDVAARGIDIPGVELVVQLEPPKDTETYIHRSGRTGRAGAKGTALVFYTPKQMYFLQQIERAAKIKLNRVGVPQEGDIIESSIKQAVKDLDKVSEKVLPLFLPTATRLMKENNDDAASLLAACLAKITGYTEPLKKRSLLCSQSGWITIHLKYTASEIRSLGFVWGLIKRHLLSPEEADQYVRGMRLTADHHGAVFDIPADFEEKIKSLETELNDPRLSFEIAKSLPELAHLEVGRPEGSGGRRSFGGRSSGGGGGGFGGGADRRASGGGRGRGGGGRGRGGGGRGKW